MQLSFTLCKNVWKNESLIPLYPKPSTLRMIHIANGLKFPSHQTQKNQSNESQFRTLSEYLWTKSQFQAFLRISHLIKNVRNNPKKHSSQEFTWKIYFEISHNCWRWCTIISLWYFNWNLNLTSCRRKSYTPIDFFVLFYRMKQKKIKKGVTFSFI